MGNPTISLRPHPVVAHLVLLLLMVLASCKTDEGIVSLPERSTPVPVIEAYIDHDDYLSLLDSRMANVRVPVDFRYRGEILHGTIEAVGAGSRYYPRWSYRFRLDEGESIEDGLRDFNVSAQVHDRPLMRTALASELFRAAGFTLFRSRHTMLSINGRTMGLFVMLERIDEDYFQRRGMPVEELIKLGFDSRFTFEGGNNPVRSFEKPIPDDGNLGNLIEMIHALDTTRDDRILQDLSRYFDIPQYLRYHAVASVMRADDNFRNNFYLYRRVPGVPYQVLPWDFDLAFDPNSTTEFYGNNDIIRKLLRNDSCFALYRSNLIDVVENIFTEERLFPIIDSITAINAAAYNLSPWHGGNGFSLQEDGEVLKTFIRDRRRQLLQDLPGFVD